MPLKAPRVVSGSWPMEPSGSAPDFTIGAINISNFSSQKKKVEASGRFLKWWVFPQIIHLNRVFHSKPSILGYPYFWKHPSGECLEKKKALCSLEGLFSEIEGSFSQNQAGCLLSVDVLGCWNEKLVQGAHFHLLLISIPTMAIYHAGWTKDSISSPS